MKKHKSLLILAFFIVASNFPPLYGFFRIFIEGVVIEGLGKYMYVTKDLNYYYDGSLKDTLRNACYRQYIQLQPKHAHTLYRIHPIEVWKFWHWHEYLVEEKWQQPYLPVSNEELKKVYTYFEKTYHTPNGVCELDTDILQKRN